MAKLPYGEWLGFASLIGAPPPHGEVTLGGCLLSEKDPSISLHSPREVSLLFHPHSPSLYVSCRAAIPNTPKLPQLLGSGNHLILHFDPLSCWALVASARGPVSSHALIHALPQVLLASVLCFTSSLDTRYDVQIVGLLPGG